MTEAEWLASPDPEAMLRSLDAWSAYGGSKIPERKLRCWVEACRAVVDSRSKMPIEWISLDEPNDLQECVGAWAGDLVLGNHLLPLAERADLLRDVVGNPFRPVTLPPEPEAEPSRCRRCGAESCDHETGECRCADCGSTEWTNPIAAVPWWKTPTVLSLAGAAYEERLPDGTLDPAGLAVLSDAMEEAGCAGEREHDWMTSEFRSPTAPCRRCGIEWATDGHRAHGKVCQATHPLLAHLRSPGPHVRGCWAISLILGEE